MGLNAGVVSRLWTRYDKAVWARFLGQVISSMGGFMIGPFITLYLNKKLHVPLMSTMAVVSIAPVVGLLVGAVSGPLADRFGRKPLMTGSLFGMSTAMVLYGFAGTVWQFALITILEGVCAALFGPAASAQVADVVAEEKRAEVFSLLHMGLNIGAAVGPSIGAAFFETAPQMLFFTAGAAGFVSALVILFFVPESKPARDGTHHVHGKAASAARARRLSIGGIFKEYGLVMWLVVLTLPISFLYSQVRTTLPLHLSHHFVNYPHVFATMMTVNGSLVILLQMIITRLGRSQALWILISFSYVMFGLVGLGYAWAPSLAILLVTEFVFTLGEMVGGPQLQHLISVIAPVEKRGTYFAIFGLRWGIPEMSGPLLGGWVFSRFGGAALFCGIAALLLLSGILMVITVRRVTSTAPAGSVEVSA